MLFEPDFFQRAQCTDAEKTELLPVVHRLVGLAEKSAHDGLLALGGAVDECDPFTAFGLRHVVDGTDPSLMRKELLARIASDNHRGKALLEQMLITEAMLCIADGISPAVTKIKLLAYLGEKVYFAAR